MKMFQLKSKKFLSIMAVFFAVLFGMMANGCGGGGGTTTTTTPTVEAPGEPFNFVLAPSSVGGELSATLLWETPVTGGEVDTYEIYRSNTVDNIFDPANYLDSIQAEANKTDYEFIDNAGLVRGVTTYWTVAAKNAGGETPAFPVSYTPPGAGAGEVEGYGNNFAAAMIFAEGIGIGNKPITGEWTENNISLVDYNTSLRPVIEENASVLPYFDENTTYVKDGVIYYKQKTASTWQGEWLSTSAPDTQNVTAKWGDNLISQTLNTDSTVRIEMVLTKVLDTNMTAYKMESLYAGGYDNEIYGTDGTTYETNTSFVVTAYARLTIEKIDDQNQTIAIVDDQLLFEPIPDGPGKFAAEINVAGNQTYGYVWDIQNSNVPDPVAGTYRITFTLEQDSNVIIDDVALPDEGENPYTLPVLKSPTEVYIDITINQ